MCLALIPALWAMENDFGTQSVCDLVGTLVETATTDSSQEKMEAVNTIIDSMVQFRGSEVFYCLNKDFLRAAAQTMGGLGLEVS
jgi:hypothetical protein